MQRYVRDVIQSNTSDLFSKKELSIELVSLSRKREIKQFYL